MITNGITGTRYVQNRRDQRNGRIKGVISHTAPGTSSIVARLAGVREVASEIAIGCRSRTAQARIDRASPGAKWWNAVKIVRNPVRFGGTSVALTDPASYRTPGLRAIRS